MAVLILFPFSSWAQDTDDDMAFRFQTKVTFTRSGSDIAKDFWAILPAAQTNEYQTILKVSISEGNFFQELTYGNNFLKMERKQFNSGTIEFSTWTHVRPIQVQTDFSKITEIKPYDPESEVCKLYLGDCDVYIDTKNSDLMAMGDRLWDGSTDVLDYARKCYEYIASDFEYDEYEEWHSLKRILKNHSGSSSDFATLFVNLMRYKGIPARHNVGVSYSQTPHTFADFYLEGYGWIPVDAALKNLSPSEDYFGYFDGNTIVLSQGIGYEMPFETLLPVVIVPTCYYEFTPLGTDCKLDVSFDFINEGYTSIDGVQSVPMKDSNAIYDLNGRQVPSSYKGLVIYNGRKYLKK